MTGKEAVQEEVTIKPTAVQYKPIDTKPNFKLKRANSDALESIGDDLTKIEVLRVSQVSIRVSP